MLGEKILVTGAGGMLGSHIVQELLARRYRVKAMFTPGSKSWNDDFLVTEVVRGDIRNLSDCMAAAAGCSVVVHAAASTSMWPRRSQTIWDINYTGLANMMISARQAGVRRFLHISSASCFGPGDKERPADETTFFKGHKYGLDYVDSKYAAHQYAMEQAQVGEMQVLAICPTFMIGPNDIHFGTGQVISALGAGKLRFVSGGGKNFVYVGDVATATVRAIEKGRSGEAYIAGGQNLHWIEFARMVSDTLQTPPPLLRLPDWMILTAGRLNTRVAQLLGYRPALNISQARASLDCQFYDPSKARREIDLPNTDLRIAIQKAWEWLGIRSEFSDAGEKIAFPNHETGAK